MTRQQHYNNIPKQKLRTEILVNNNINSIFYGVLILAMLQEEGKGEEANPS